MEINSKELLNKKLPPFQKLREGVYKKYIKRIMDLILAAVAIILLLPLLFFIAFLVRIKLGSPVIFKQQRPGLNGRIFTLYKFRTMTEAMGKDGNLLPDEMRLTKFGGFLRTTSMDELPELFNILNGTMSFVGPRPLLVQYLPLYNHSQIRRHEVRPGLSGLAQVNGRNAINWEDKFRLDIEYVDNVSFSLDLKIILITLKKVILREGINSENSVTAELFVGSTSEDSVE